MVAPRFRQAKKKMRRTPGGHTRPYYKLEKKGKGVCACCRKQLHGVKNLSAPDLAKFSKTEKRPERIFGGVLCGNCTRQIIKEKARLQSGVIGKEDVDLIHHKYISMMK